MAEVNVMPTASRLMEAVESLAEGVAIYDAEDRLVLFNRQYSDLLSAAGTTLQPGMRFEDVARVLSDSGLFVEVAGLRYDWLENRLRQHRNPAGPIEALLADGRWLSLRDRRTEDGFTIATISDITVLKQREVAVAQSERQAETATRLLSDAIESIPEGFVLFDADDRLMLCNQHYRRRMALIEDLLVPGESFERLVRAAVDRGMIADAKADPEGWVRQRLHSHRFPPGPQGITLASGQIIAVREYRTRDGGYVGVQNDITQRLQTEQALSETQARYRRLVELVPDLICVLVDGRINYINAAGGEMLGVPPEQLVGRRFADFLPDDQAISFNGGLQDLTERRMRQSLRLRIPGGGLLDTEVAALPFTRDGADPDAETVMLVVRDVTELRRSALAVLGREQRLRGIMNTVLDGIFTCDEQGIIESFNPAAEKIFGWTADEILGQSISLLIPDALLPAASKGARRSPSRSGREDVGRRKDGAEFPLELSINALRLDNRRLLTGVVHDVTRRKMAERALRQSEERYALAMAGTSDGMWDWDIAADLVYISPRMAVVVGMQGEPPRKGRDWLTFVHSADRAMFTAAMTDHLRGRTEFFVCQYRLAQNPDRWVRHRGLALRNDKGRPYRMAGSVGDVTEQMRAERTLREAKELAELASRAKSEFLANMSHELRTPLNAIIGFSEMMMGEMLGPIGTPAYRDYATSINESGSHLLDVINDILDVSRVEAGKLDLEPEPVYLRPVFDASLRLIQQRADSRGVRLVRSWPDDLPPLLGEPRRFKQVMLNLLANAVKFTPEGGTVTLSARRLEGGGIEISVTDTGIGMKPEDIPRALTPFTQVDSSLARRYEGTGLGLPLAKTLVELHNGTLSIVSAPNQGTTVLLRFPASQIVG